MKRLIADITRANCQIHVDALGTLFASCLEPGAFADISKSNVMTHKLKDPGQQDRQDTHDRQERAEQSQQDQARQDPDPQHRKEQDRNPQDRRG